MSRKKLAPGCELASFCRRIELSGSLRSRYGSGVHSGLGPRLRVAAGVPSPPTGGAVSPQSMMPVISVSWKTESLVCSAVPSGPAGDPSLPPSRANAPAGVDGSTLRTSLSKGELGLRIHR